MQITSESRARLANQLIENFGPSKESWNGDVGPLEELAGLPEADQLEVLTSVKDTLGADTFVNQFMPRIDEVGTSISAFAASQNVEAGAGAAKEIRPTAEVRVRAAEQARLQAKAETNESEMPLTDLADNLAKQKDRMKADVLAADIPADVKKKLGASIDAMDVPRLQAATGRFEMAMSRLQSRMDRMRSIDPAKADKAEGEMLSGAHREIRKMASQVRDVSRSDTILRMLNSNLPIEKLLLIVMLLMFEDNDEQLREKLKDQAEANKLADEMRKARAKIEDAQTSEELDGAVSAAEALEDGSIKEALDEVSETQSKIVGDGNAPANETEEKKEEVKKAQSGETSGAQVQEEAAVSAAKKEPVQLSMFTPAEMDGKKPEPPSPQLSLDFDAQPPATPPTGIESESTSATDTKSANATTDESATAPATPVRPPVIGTQPKPATAAETVTPVTGQAPAGTAQSKPAAAAPPGTPPNNPPNRDATPAAPAPQAAEKKLSLNERKERALRDLDNKQRTFQDSVAKINFEIQGLVDTRKQSLELISKLLSDLSAMCQTVIRNMQ